jgi:hypothetical protein
VPDVVHCELGLHEGIIIIIIGEVAASTSHIRMLKPSSEGCAAASSCSEPVDGRDHARDGTMGTTNEHAKFAL